jgi:hypothetical protein
MTVMTSNTLRESAIEYAQRSILVFPLHYVRDGVIRCSCGDPECTNSGKHPRTANGLLDGTRDVTQLCEWWDALPKSNVGLCTGAESGFIVLDVDPRHGGHVTLAALEEKHGKLPDTATTVTGSSGNHRLFKHPGRKVPNDAGLKLGAGLDIRGDGGYIVAPPSNHLLGQYGWKSGLSLDDVELAPLPEWLAMLIVEAPKPKQVVRVESHRYLDAPGSGRYWLEKALDAGGDRNNRGMWMMAQMRDAGMSKADCIPFVIEYVSRVPASNHPYTDKEALKTLDGIFSRTPRAPAKSANGNHIILKIGNKARAIVAREEGDAVTELRQFYAGVRDGKIVNVPFPWKAITGLTQALLPASIMMLCGDPGIGKTFWTLQCLLYWYANDFNPAVFFIEKNRLFHVRRLLAQLEGNGKFIELEWAKEHSGEVEAAMDRHASIIKELADHIHSRKGGRITLDDLLTWLRESAQAGNRVLVIDPITAAFAGADRWMADDAFVTGAQDIVSEFNASLVLVTHPTKLKRIGLPSMNDMGGGAAFQRFVDTVIWLERRAKKKRVHVKTIHGPGLVTPDVIAHLCKTRDGTGGGLQLAMTFGGNGLHFKEEGIIVREEKEEAA